MPIVLLASGSSLRPLGPLAVAAPSGVTITCSVPGDEHERVYVFDAPGPEWRLSFRSAETAATWVRVSLPGARPTVTSSSARLSYRNANGGRQVTLTVDEGRSTLDVWIDHGLEVNVEPDLDPRVDLMTTNGPLAGVRCAIEGAPAP